MVFGATARLLPVTAPTLGLMLRLVAPLTDQERMLLWPAVIEEGVAVKLPIIGTRGGAVTFTITIALTDPATFVAVSVYDVVVVGVTVRLLPVTAPMFGLMLRLVAPLTDQERVLL